MKLTIKTISDYKVKCDFLVEGENFPSEILLDEKCQIKLLGAESDIMLTSQDFSPKEIANFQAQIDESIQHQSVKLLNMSSVDGHYYQMENTCLQGAPALNDGKCSNEWYEISELNNAVVIESINKYFNSHFSEISFRS